MWQIVKENQEKKLEANVYTDQKLNFTTTVSQEFTPKLSQVGRSVCTIAIYSVLSLAMSIGSRSENFYNQQGQGCTSV